MKPRFAKVITQRAEIPAYIYNEDEANIYYVNMTMGGPNRLSQTSKEYILEEKILKGYTPEAKSLVKDFLKAELKAQELERKIEDIKKPYIGLSTLLTKANGLLTKEEFVEELKHNGLQIPEGSDVRTFNLHLTISKQRTIKKWFGESEFTYRNYDGALMLTEDCEQSKLYQRLLNGSRINTNAKEKYVEESLGTGDKDSLFYAVTISFDIKKPLTSAYAKEIAEKIITGPVREVKEEALMGADDFVEEEEPEL